MRSSFKNNIESSKRSLRRDLTELFSIRRGSRQYPVQSSSGRRRSSISTRPKPTEAAIQHGLKILNSIFPTWEMEPLKLVFEAHKFDMDETITALLEMNEAESPPCFTAQCTTEITCADSERICLPEDFLRLPVDDDSESDAEGDDEEEEITSDEGCEQHKCSLKSTLEGAGNDTDPNKELAAEAETLSVSEETDRAERATFLAEDDGTLYGKVYPADTEEGEEVVHPVLNDDELVSKRQLVSDSVNQKFIPLELRNSRPSIMDTASIDVIKRSRLNLTDAEKRIRHREPHLAFNLLSKASEIYRSGVISSQELDTLRSHILALIQPSKMLMDLTAKTDGLISDHEWHLLVLKCKNLRQALSVRLVHEQVGKPQFRDPRPMAYLIRVVDVETGIVWFTTKRQKDILRLFRKLSKISDRVRTFALPNRLHQGRHTNLALPQSRARHLEQFLRLSATLVTPSPLSFLHGIALRELQHFLDVPAESMMHPKRTQRLTRQLRVFVYHTVNDVTTPEGKACHRFSQQLQERNGTHDITLLNGVGDLLDGLQEYMLEHRMQELLHFAERLIKVFATVASNQCSQAAIHSRHSSRSGSARGWKSRNPSYVNILASLDDQTRHDKLYTLISDAIRYELEERICVPLMQDLVMILRQKVYNKEKQFQARVQILRGRSQEEFGILENTRSSSSWRIVIQTIKEMDGAFLPGEKMSKLVATAHQIHALHRAEHSISHSNKCTLKSAETSDTTLQLKQEIGKPKEVMLSGDDFLPIFIFVLAHSNLEAPVLTQVLLNRLCDPEKRHSETGYYLATFEAAVHHILSMEI